MGAGVSAVAQPWDLPQTWLFLAGGRESKTSHSGPGTGCYDANRAGLWLKIHLFMVRRLPCSEFRWVPLVVLRLKCPGTVFLSRVSDIKSLIT